MNYIEIVHECIIKDTMNHFHCPEKIDLLPYLAKYYCNYLIDNDESSKPGNNSMKSHDDDENLHLSYIDEDKPHLASKEEKEKFKGWDKQKIACLNTMFITFTPKSGSSTSSPLNLNGTPTSTPTRQSYETLEVLDFSSLRESFLHTKKIFSQLEPQIISSRINHIKPSLDYVPSRIYGPRLNVETPQGLTEESLMESVSSIGYLELRKVVSLCDNPNLNANDSFSSHNFSLRIESPKLSSGLPQKKLENESFTPLSAALSNKEKEAKGDNRLNDDIFKGFGVNLYRAASEKINLGDHNKNLYLTHHKSQEPLKDNSISSEKENIYGERRKKKIFEPKSPEKETIKYLKNSDLGLENLKRRKGQSKENRLEKENKFIKNQKRQTMYPWDNYDLSLWEIIAGEKEKKQRISLGNQGPVLKMNGSQHNPWDRNENINIIQDRIREEGSIIVKNLDTVKREETFLLIFLGRIDCFRSFGSRE